MLRTLRLERIKTFCEMRVLRFLVGAVDANDGAVFTPASLFSREVYIY